MLLNLNKIANTDNVEIPSAVLMKHTQKIIDLGAKHNLSIILDEACRHGTKWIHLSPENNAVVYALWEASEEVIKYWATLKKGTFRIAAFDNTHANVFKKLTVAYRAATNKNVEVIDLVYPKGVDGTKDISASNIRGWNNSAILKFGGPDIIIGCLNHRKLIDSLRPGGVTVLFLPPILSMKDVAAIEHLRLCFENSYITVTTFDYFFFIGIKMNAGAKLRSQVNNDWSLSPKDYPILLSNINTLYIYGAEARSVFYESILKGGGLPTIDAEWIAKFKYKD